MTRIDVKGVIVSNDDKWIYDYFEIENTSPNDVLNKLPKDNSPIEVIINSPGGDVFAGSEIYTELKEYPGNITVKIVGIAASAASVVAMAGTKVLISPTAQIMIHNVSSIAQGDYRVMKHEAEMLKNYNKSIANAYMLKTGLSQEELLTLMDKETWLNAQQAKEKGFVDEIMFDSTNRLVAGPTTSLLPQNVINKMRNMKNELINNQQEEDLQIPNHEENEKSDDLEMAKAKLKLKTLEVDNYA